MTRLVTAAGLALAVVAAPAAQVGSSSATITGRVMSNDEPVPNARVTLAPARSATPIVLTDASGDFSIALSSRTQHVIVTKTGFVRADVAPTEHGPLAIQLQRAGVISGTVTDETGAPAVRARISAERAGAATERPIAVAFTDDRGEYRLSGLPAGTFLVEGLRDAGIMIAGQRPQSTSIYYPDATAREDAEAVTVEPGAETNGIDFVVPLPAGVLRAPAGMMVLARPPLATSGDEPTGRSAIAGRVAMTDGHPVPRATVMLSGGPAWPRREATADDDGRYLFSQLPAGTFFVAAFRDGYLGVDSGPTRAGFNGAESERMVALDEAQRRDDVDITMVGAGTLTGQVFDELGEPVEGARIQLLQPRYDRGRRRLAPAGGLAQTTDDRGMFRAFDVHPGQYIVSASFNDVGSVQLPAYARTYFPGTSNPADAQYVSVGPLETVSGIDVSMSRARTFTVSGRLLDSSGQPTTGGTLQLIPSYRSNTAVDVPIPARISDDGQFTFAGVAPGQYVIRADRGRRNRSAEGEFGTLPVTVAEANVSGLLLQTSAGSAIRGHVTFDAAPDVARPSPGSFDISPVPVDPDTAPNSPADAEIADDWTFEMTGVSGTRRLEVGRIPQGWALEAIRVRGVDATDRPIAFGTNGQPVTDVEVVLTDRAAALAGTVSDDHAKAAAGSHVIVFPVDRDRWYPGSRFLAQAVVAEDGTFHVDPIAPQNYYVSVVARLPDGGGDEWRDPAFLESLLTRAVTVTIGEGEKRNVALKVP